LNSRWLLLPLCLGVVATAAPDSATVAEEVAEQFKCAVCHTERLTEFRRRRAVALVEHDPEPVLPSGQQVEVSTPAMCFSCHDGFVLDSRNLWKEGHLGHPIGVAPSSNIATPVVDGETLFPMNLDGRMYCGSCHSAHFSDAESDEAPPFMRVDPSTGDLCQSCHVENTSVADGAHAARVRRGRHIPDFQPRGACSRCHQAHEALGPALWAREPGQGNTAVETLCNSCHEGDVDPSGHPVNVTAWSAQLRLAHTQDTGAPMPVFDQDGSQADIGVISCATCHNAHREQVADDENGWPDRFLRRADSRNFLCADCHGESSLHRYLYFHSPRSRRNR